MAGKFWGKHFEVDVTGITIFGWELERLSATSWRLGIFEVSPSSVAGDIEKLIQSDLEAGNGEKIDQILVSEKIFAVLYCEGRVTLNQMRKATETEDAVIVHDVKFLDKEYTVKVMDSDVLNIRYGTSEFRMATIDLEGEIV